MKVIQLIGVVIYNVVRKVPVSVWAILIGVALGFVLRGYVGGPKVQPVVSGNTSTYTLPKTDLKPGDVAPIISSPVVQPLVQAQRKAGKKVEVVAQATGTITIPVPDSPSTPIVSQPVEAIAVVGKDDKGQPAATLDLFKVEPDGTRTPLPDSKTVVVVAQPQKPHWRVGFGVQAGVGYGTETEKFKATPMATIALQWLARGSSRAAEDKSWALLSPAILLADGSAEPGLLPLSVNLGHIPHQPLKDFWLSPFVGVKSSGLGHVGVILTTTF